MRVVHHFPPWRIVIPRFEALPRICGRGVGWCGKAARVLLKSCCGGSHGSRSRSRLPSADEDDAIIDVWGGGDGGGGGGVGGGGGGGLGVDKSAIQRGSLVDSEVDEETDYIIIHILRDWAMGTEFVDRCRFGVLFYVALMPISALIAVMLRYLHSLA